ncbi:DNA mismatch repair protein MutS [Croceitalea marina]|uniref:DNA mismatch repair protein MutS n=1 Tax=Croceitalea marina TaxID=1775166 RepID=A0ABW5MWH7_9FLAO
MQDPNVFYKEQLYNLKSLIKSDKKRLNLLSLLRLSVFIGSAFLIYFFSDSPRIAAVIAIIGIGIFIKLLKIYASRKTSYDLNKALKTLNKEELQIAKGDYLNREDGSAFLDANHFFSADIDLFGKGSFFQYTNRTGLKEGRRFLADLLDSNKIIGIEERQEAIKELAQIPKWRQKYTALARMLNSDTSNDTITSWLKNYQSFIPAHFKWLPAIFTVISFAFFIASFFNLIGFQPILIWLLLGLVVTGFFVKRVNKLSAITNRIKETIQQYALLLREIEDYDFKTILLNSEKEKIKSNQQKASQVFKDFSKHLDALDNRNNVFVAFLGNGFFLWDIYYSMKIEKWIVAHKDLVSQWFETVGFFDGFNSLAGFAYNHPEFTYPQLSNTTDMRIDAKSLGHPLIASNDRVCSDLQLKNKEFFIVTGANMAGKSTFLRTVSSYIVMANVGLPVCAEESVYRPIKLITSMRTSDSLTKNSSYFFAELTRLQFIIKNLEKGTYLVILDEILKGTNSVDKAAGSKKLIEKLVAMDVSGIIATHDLSLCEISTDLPEVKNYYFETEIRNDELYFDYTFKEGICKNMNASFLLKKMDIT